MEGIKWLFFDIGSTLADESRALERRVRETVAGTGVSFSKFWAEMVSHAALGSGCYPAALEHFGLKKTPWPGEEERLYPGVPELLEELARSYRLGIIANQVPGLEGRMEQWGIRPCFSLILSSAEEGVAKPDPAIFRRALERAGCAPREAMMIGDRLDNDVAPAGALGFTTVWVRQGINRDARVEDAGRQPDHILNAVTELRELLNRGR